MTRITLSASLAAATLALSLAAAPALAQQAAPSSPAKKDLVARVLKLQQPGIDAVARQLVEQPAMQMYQQAGLVTQQRVAADRRQAVIADIQADIRKYVEDNAPVVRDKAAKLAPGVLGPMLEEKFSEDELKQLIGILESPVNRKYQSMGGEMQKALAEKLVADVRGTLEPKFKSLQQTVAGRMAPPASAPAGK